MTTEREDPTDDDRDRPEPEETHTVDLDAPEDTEKEKDDDGEGERETRAERRAERGRLKTELEETRTQNRELLERVSRMEGAIQQSMRDTRESSQRARVAEDDPLQTELDDIYEQQEALAERAAALGPKITQEQLDKLSAKNRRLDQRKLEIISERTGRRNAPRVDRGEEDKRAFQMANRDVFKNPAAAAYAKAEFIRLVNHPNAALRKTNSEETLTLALENTRKEFGMSRGAPTQQERDRTSGVSRGGTGGGAKRDNVVGMGKFEKGLADKAFPHIKDDNKRWDQWAKSAGKKMLERKVKAGGKR